MDTSKKVAVIGGDTRQVFCAKALSSLGFETVIFGFENYIGEIGNATKCNSLNDVIKFCDIVILPLPACSDGCFINMPLSSSTLTVEDLFEKLSQKHTVMYGKYCEKIESNAKRKNINVFDYYQRDEFQIANSVPTAESAMAIAINETPITLHNSTCLVMGYGRIGKILCKYLNSFGATVYASARKHQDLAWISANGYNSVNTNNLESVIDKCNIIFNTIPKIILKDELLNKISKSTLIIDLASKPGGVDFDSAKKEGLNVIWALSLPGKTAPVSAGQILCDTIINILSETEG